MKKIYEAPEMNVVLFSIDEEILSGEGKVFNPELGWVSDASEFGFNF